MKKNVLSLYDVISASRQLIEKTSGDKYASIDVPIDLKDDNGVMNHYVSHLICKRSEVEYAINLLKTFNGLTKKDYIEKNPYCHISTFLKKYAYSYLVSFDMNDDEPCKVEFSKEYDYYDYLNGFFTKYNNMRNDLIDNGCLVKEDDIYQFLDIVFSHKKESNNNSNFQKIKSRFINSK